MGELVYRLLFGAQQGVTRGTPIHIPEGQYTLKDFCRIIFDSPERVLEGYHGQRIKSFLYLSDEGWRDYLEHYYKTEELGGITEFVG